MHHIPTRTVVILKVYIDDLSGFKVYGNKNSNIYSFYYFFIYLCLAVQFI